MVEAHQTTSVSPGEPAFDLQRFFPYRLAILAEQVSETVAQIYADRFDLGRQEWRILSAIGYRTAMPSKEAGDYAALDKMQVSRAVASLVDKGLATREIDPADRRNHLLRLTEAGRALYLKIIPLALAREAFVLDALSPEEARVLDAAMTKLSARAGELRRIG
jgi:DNA-binding MarR family transcriptional regulator